MISATISNKDRQAIYRREGFTCAACGDNRQLQIHHIVKRSRGGTSNPENLVCLCSGCHALAHGTVLWPEYADITQEEMELAITQYMADYYIDHGLLWRPNELVEL